MQVYHDATHPPARFNFRCDDALHFWNFAPRGHVFAVWGAGAKRFEIVIAIRYLQAEGTSHAHLYLYREDGKLLRQLTNDNSGQDSVPIFAPDGSVIVFTHEKSDNASRILER